MDESKYNVEGTDRQIFTTNIKGEEVDLALTYGDKGKKYQDSVRAAEKKLTPEKRQEIIKEKERLQNAWFFKEKRYKTYKENLDKQLGIVRFGRDPIKQAEHYNRNDIYGHRTSNLDSIIEHGLLSAFDAHKKGLLKSTESGNSVLSTILNGRERSSTPSELKINIYSTKGLMPADSSYGPYGVLFRSRSMEPSKHLNFIPEEHLTKKVKGNLTFVVPDSEFEDWTKKHPEKKFLRESEIPENKKLQSASYVEPIKRLLSGPKFIHESKEIEKIAELRIPLRTQNSQINCSATCLRMVLAHHNILKSEEELAELIGVHKRGAEGSDIVKGCKKLNIKATWKQFSPEEVMSLLEKEIPIIADIKSFNYEGKNHWVVIEEIDLKNNKVRIADPNVKGNRRYISLKELDERWQSRDMYTGKPLTRAGVIIIIS
jgi:hypothetical protein